MAEREEEKRRADELADQLEDRAESMEQRSGELEDEIKSARSDWESKKQTEGVPGAQTEEGAGDPGMRSGDEEADQADEEGDEDRGEDARSPSSEDAGGEDNDASSQAS
jgi:hypothetical protein